MSSVRAHSAVNRDQGTSMARLPRVNDAKAGHVNTAISRVKSRRKSVRNHGIDNPGSRTSFADSCSLQIEDVAAPGRPVDDVHAGGERPEPARNGDRRNVALVDRQNSTLRRRTAVGKGDARDSVMGVPGVRRNSFARVRVDATIAVSTSRRSRYVIAAIGTGCPCTISHREHHQVFEPSSALSRTAPPNTESQGPSSVSHTVRV